MPTIEELIDQITNELDKIEDTFNQEGVKTAEDYEGQVAEIDQKWAMLRQMLMKLGEGEGEDN